MLATAATTIPVGDQWLHEVKWDGMRVIADISQGRLRLTSRTERDITHTLPELAGLADRYPDATFDGEVVVMRNGTPSFAALAERFGVTAGGARLLAATAPVTFLVFDLLRLYGVPLLDRPLTDRRATLERLDLTGSHWLVPETFEDGQALLAVTSANGLEGVVSKDRTSRYLPGTRSDRWLKVAHRATASLVVGGWRGQVDRPGTLGAVLVGTPAPGGLRYLGRVGSGLAGRAGEALRAELATLAAPESPFVDEVPAVDRDGAAWVHPVLVAQVRYLGMTRGGRLRQPSFLGLRHDLTAGDVPTGPADVLAAGDDGA